MSADQILSRLEQIVSRLEAVEAKVGGGAAPGGASAAPAEQGASAKAWDDLCSSYFAPFQATTEKIGGDNVKAQVNLMATGNCDISKLINVASQSKQPAVADLQKVVAPIAASIKGIKELRESNRRDKQVIILFFIFYFLFFIFYFLFFIFYFLFFIFYFLFFIFYFLFFIFYFLFFIFYFLFFIF